MNDYFRNEVKDIPVTVAVDSRGESVHKTGPEKWQKIIFESKQK